MLDFFTNDITKFGSMPNKIRNLNHYYDDVLNLGCFKTGGTGFGIKLYMLSSNSVAIDVL